MEIVKVVNNVPVLDSEIASQIAEYERKVKLIEEEEKRLRNAILKAMEEHNIVKIDMPELLINYIPEGDKEYFDQKKFKEDHHDLFDEYVSIKPVKAMVRVKVR